MKKMETKLHSIMAERGMSIADLAHTVGCSRANVAKWCAGIVKLTDDDISKIAMALKMSKRELIGLLK